MRNHAIHTGYSTGGEVELWLGSDQGDDGIYVAAESGTEWWPRGTPVRLTDHKTVG